MPPGFPPRAGEQGHTLLLSVEHAEDSVGRDRLWPEDIAGMVRLLGEPAGGVAVEDRTAEGDVFGRMSVATERHMAAG